MLSGYLSRTVYLTEEEEKGSPMPGKTVVRIRDITECGIFANVASLVDSNALQNLLVKLYSFCLCVPVGYVHVLVPVFVHLFLAEATWRSCRKREDQAGYICGTDLMKTFATNGICPNQASSLASIVIMELDTGRCRFSSFCRRQVRAVCPAQGGVRRDREQGAGGGCRGPGPGRAAKGNISQQDTISLSKRQTNLDISKADLKRIFGKFDTDGDGPADGLLSFGDFVQVVFRRVAVSQQKRRTR